MQLAPAPLMLNVVAVAPVTEAPDEVLVLGLPLEPHPAASSAVAAAAATPATPILRLRSNM
jgi:hypothetical protein